MEKLIGNLITTLLFISFTLTANAQNVGTPEKSKPSFDCTKASSATEKCICDDPLLGKLDVALTDNYKHMLAADIGKGAKEDLKTQKSWILKEIIRKDKKSLIELYRQRIDEICEYPVISGMHPICTESNEIQ